MSHQFGPNPLAPTHMPGSSRQMPAQDQVGDGSFLLVLPGEDGLCVSPEVCVWAQEGIKEQGHRALAPAFKAFRQVIQVLGPRGAGQRGHWSKATWSCIPTLIPGWSDKPGKCCLSEGHNAHQHIKGSDKSCSCYFPV